jgi:hypothetical protein
VNGVYYFNCLCCPTDASSPINCDASDYQYHSPDPAGQCPPGSCHCKDPLYFTYRTRPRPMDRKRVDECHPDHFHHANERRGIDRYIKKDEPFSCNPNLKATITESYVNYVKGGVPRHAKLFEVTVNAGPLAGRILRIGQEMQEIGSAAATFNQVAASDRPRHHILTYNDKCYHVLTRTD